MTDILVTLILAVCPTPDKAELTKCHEFFVNCAVGTNGEITEKLMRKCVKEWRERDEAR